MKNNFFPTKQVVCIIELGRDHNYFNFEILLKFCENRMQTSWIGVWVGQITIWPVNRNRSWSEYGLVENEFFQIEYKYNVELFITWFTIHIKCTFCMCANNLSLVSLGTHMDLNGVNVKIRYDCIFFKQNCSLFTEYKFYLHKNPAGLILQRGDEGNCLHAPGLGLPLVIALVPLAMYNFLFY